jgi:hypothetical protein
MFLPKFSYIIIFLWIIFRRNQITGEILNASCARSKSVNLECHSLDNAYIITSVLNITDTTEKQRALLTGKGFCPETEIGHFHYLRNLAGQLYH